MQRGCLVTPSRAPHDAPSHLPPPLPLPPAAIIRGSRDAAQLSVIMEERDTFMHQVGVGGCNACHCIAPAITSAATRGRDRDRDPGR